MCDKKEEKVSATNFCGNNNCNSYFKKEVLEQLDEIERLLKRLVRSLEEHKKK